MTAYNQDTLTEPGQYYTFRTQRQYGEYFAITPTHNPPHNSQPIVDEKTGVCIGYSVAQAPGLWQIYDADGRFATLEESPLESPLIDPIDIALITFGAFRLLTTGRALFEAAASNRIKVVLSEATLNILRGRFKVGLSATSLKFTHTTAAHMAEPGRFIPVQILEKAVRYGVRSSDPQKITGQFIYRIGMTRLTKKVVGNAIVYSPKKYTLHVLVRERDWTVMHFHIKEM
jgi:hypothetical protein